MHIDSAILENSIYIMEEEFLEECMSKSQNEYSEYLERKRILIEEKEKILKENLERRKLLKEIEEKKKLLKENK